MTSPPVEARASVAFDVLVCLTVPRFTETRKYEVATVSYLKWDLSQVINISVGSVEARCDGLGQSPRT